MRRATERPDRRRSARQISIHALHEESDRLRMYAVGHDMISIHALHEESDRQREVLSPALEFQSTLSMRRATEATLTTLRPLLTFQSTLSMRRATCGLREHHRDAFISIHALHEESDPAAGCHFRIVWKISIHALHEESDGYATDTTSKGSYFNPRSP